MSPLPTGGDLPTGHAAEKSDQSPSEKVSVYKIVMTPINFVSFIFSLVLVDIHYSCVRIHSHAGTSSRVPGWLHRLIFRPQSKETLGNGAVRSPHHREEISYYQSNQGKLMKFEAEEAFRVRNRIIIAMAVVFAMAIMALWRLMQLVYYRWSS